MVTVRTWDGHAEVSVRTCLGLRVCECVPAVVEPNGRDG